MNSTSLCTRLLALASAVAVALTGIAPVANAGPGIAPVYSANAAPPPSPPDTFANTYYANSPLGLRTDLVANPLNPIAPGTIDTGNPLRKFVDILPGVHAFAPSTNIGTGFAPDGTGKYIPVAVPTKWPADHSDYYHIAIVEYAEYLHSDLPKGSILRGYVQIEEPGATTTPAGSKHIPLHYPNGTAMVLPDASGTLQPVYAYDNPHYLGPVINATKDVAVRIKYSNLLPVGDATGIDPWGNPLGNGAPNRNGDLPVPVDATLSGGALPQNRIDVHLHGGLTPWISDGNPHQWTIPVGDTRFSYLSDIAVTAVGAGYSANPIVTIDPPQANATGHATLKNGSVSALYVDNPGAFYGKVPTVTIAAPVTGPTTPASAAATLSGFAVGALTVTAAGSNYPAPPTVTISPPTGVPAQASATANVAGGQVTSLTPVSNGALYASAPLVTLSAPPAAVQATAGNVTLANTGVSAISVATGGSNYSTAPVVTIAAPPATQQGVGTASLSATGTISGIGVSTAGFGYWTAPTVTVSAPTGIAATATPSVSATNGQLSLAVNANNGTYSAAPTVTVAAPPAAVTATAGASTVTAGKVTNIPVANGGFGYWTAPTVTIAAPPGNVAATATVTTAKVVTITNAGTAYTTAPTVTVNGGTRTSGAAWTATATLGTGANAGKVVAIVISGTGVYSRAPTLTIGSPPANVTATATASVANGSVTAITVTNQGTGYTTAPTVTIANGTTGTQARVTVNFAGGKVTGYTVAGGTGYNPNALPTVTVTPATRSTLSGTTATATASVANGVITGFRVTNAGSGYATAPTITIGAPTAGVQAVAAATVANGAVTGFTIRTAGSGYPTAPAVTLSAPPASQTATAIAVLTNGAVTGFTVTNHGTGYTAAPAVTIGAPTPVSTAVASAIVSGGAVTGYTVTNPGWGYTSVPTVSISAPPTPIQATANAVLAGDGTLAGLQITNAGAGYAKAPAVTIAAPTDANGNPMSIQATATAQVTGGTLTGVTLGTKGRGYLVAPNVTVTDTTGAGATISAMVAMPIGPGLHQVPDMVGTLDAAKVPAGYTSPIIGEGTLYYTNNQSERLMWYHDHTSGITRLNVYEGLAAPYLLTDPAVDPQPVGSPVAGVGSIPASALDSYVPREQIAMVVQDKTFVPKDIVLEDAQWDTAGHWGTYGDLWYPHVYETNQNPAFLHSLSNLGRWDWGPWFAIVYPSLYALPSGAYGDVTLTPEAYEDTPMINGVAYPTIQVEPRAYRFRLLNAANDRFLNLGFYYADTLQPAPWNVPGTSIPSLTEVLQEAPIGDQPGTAVNAHANVFQLAANQAFMPWPMDGGAAGPGATHIVPAPTEMGPPIISIGSEGGILPQWVQHDPIPVNYDYNRRSATVLNTSQNNDYTQQCFPECHGLYLGPAERADFVVDFAPYAGQTLILYNDGPAPNPGYDTRIDYYTGDDPTGYLNYMTGGAPNTQPGYGPNTRTILQIVVGTVQNASGSDPIDYTNALGAPTPSGLQTWDPTKLGGGRVLGVLTSNVPGPINQTYSATQPAPLVGESAYNIAFNPTTQAVNAAKGLTTSAGGYVDSYGNMYLGSQNQPEFYVTAPGPLTITGITLTGNTSATGAASGVGLGGSSSGTNVNAGGGTSYFTPPAVVISPPTACTLGVATCVQATATAAVANGQVTGFTLTNPGAGYTEAPSVLIVSGGSLNAVSLTNPGSGYTAAPQIVISQPDTCLAAQIGNAGCVQATATATLNATTGAISGITITNKGSGYSVAPTITIAAPANVAATGTATVSGGAVSAVAVTSGGTGYLTAPSVLFAAPPSGVAAVLTPDLVTVGTQTYLMGVTIVNAGAGYATPPTVTLASCGASGTTTLNATGGIATVTLTSIGAGTCSLTDTFAFSTAPAPTAAATATATIDPTTGAVTSVVITSGGSGYTSAPAVTFSGGVPATAAAAVSGGGYGAQAVAITSNTTVFIAPAAVPNNIVPATSNAVPLTLTPTAAAMVKAGAITGRLMNPAIQELFEPFYGRMNATLGIEMPNQSLTVQTTLPLNYVDPATEMWEYNKPVMWKVTHNGVDAHPVHIHLINAQVVNRVGWDGTVKQPEDDEIGWKETIKMNPLEDIILAMLPTQPQTPFGLDRAIRPQDPSQPLGVNVGFTQYSVEGYNGALNGQSSAGQAMPAQHDSAFFAKGGRNWAGGVLGNASDQAGYISGAALGVGDPATIVNSMENYDNEYVWHCHILGHEENDFMRPIPTISQPQVPLQPTSVVAAQTNGAGSNVLVTWVDPTPIANLGTPGNTTFGNPANEIGYLVQRSVDGGQTWTTVATTGANATSATDPVLATGTVQYQVVGYNAQGVGPAGQALSISVQ